MGKKVLDVKNLTIQYRTDLETVHAVNGISFFPGKRGNPGAGGRDRCGENDDSSRYHGPSARAYRCDSGGKH